MDNDYQTVSREVKGVPVTRMNDVNIPPRVYNPIETGRGVFDDFFSTNDGIPKATIVLVGGVAGTGKTTIMCDALGGASQNGHEALFISGEMDDIDFNEYASRFPKFGEYDTYFPTVERDIMSDLENLYGYGYDLVLIDSFKEIKDRIAEQEQVTKTRAEQFLIDLFKRVKNGVKTERPNPEHERVFTTTLAIQQMTTTGDFAGSEALKHVVTSTLLLEKESEEECYLMFEKNRRGEAYRKLYYTIDGDELTFNEEKREREEEAIDFVEEEKERQEEEEYSSLDELIEDNDEVETTEEESGVDSGSDWTSEWNETELTDSEHRERVKDVFESNNENRKGSMRECKEKGLFPHEDSYHYFRKMLHDYRLDEYPNY